MTTNAVLRTDNDEVGGGKYWIRCCNWRVSLMKELHGELRDVKKENERLVRERDELRRVIGNLAERVVVLEDRMGVF